MNRKANTKHDLHPIIAERWSPRAFDANKDINNDDLEAVLEAARWAASSMNEQPWRYYYAYRNDQEAFEGLWNCLMEGNQVWADKAAVLLAVTMKKNFKRNGKTNRTAQHDVGLANGQLVLEALHRSIYAHMMGGFHDDKAREYLNLADDEEVVCFMALGYIAEASTLPNETLQERELAERSRLSLEDISKKL